MPKNKGESTMEVCVVGFCVPALLRKVTEAYCCNLQERVERTGVEVCTVVGQRCRASIGSGARLHSRIMESWLQVPCGC